MILTNMTYVTWRVWNEEKKLMLIVNETCQYLTPFVYRSVHHIAYSPLSENMNTEIRHTDLNGRLPSDLYNLYGIYKKDTKAIVQ